jgi:hypothetical protein
MTIPSLTVEEGLLDGEELLEAYYGNIAMRFVRCCGSGKKIA